MMIVKKRVSGKKERKKPRRFEGAESASGEELRVRAQEWEKHKTLKHRANYDHGLLTT